jgi:hypothetical protein
MNLVQEHNIENSTKLIFITDINNLLGNFFEKVGKIDLDLYFSNSHNLHNVNFNDRVIDTLSQEQILFLKENIKFALGCLDKLDDKLKNFNVGLDYETWKICVFSKMFFDLPFTLQDVIFIPISYIESSMKKNLLLDHLFSKNSINKKFALTLIHEKIHLLQRYNQTNWNNWIISNTNWIILNKEIIGKFTLINNNKIIYNPDTYYVNDKFAYVSNNKCYYGQMLLDTNNQIKDIWCQLIESNNKYFSYPISFSVIKYEHPYEELAYKISDQLIKNTD